MPHSPRSILVLVLLLLLLLSSSVLVVSSSTSDDDVLDEPKPLSDGGGWGREADNTIPCQNDETPYEQTEQVLVDLMLDMAEISVPGESLVVYDLGSGDGRLALEAARRGATKVVGFERRKDLIRVAERRARRELGDAAFEKGVVTFKQQDVFTVNFTEADAVLMYLNPFVVERLAPRLFNQMRPGSRIVSHDYAFTAGYYPEYITFETSRDYKKRITPSSRTCLLKYRVGPKHVANSDFAIDWDGTSVFQLPSTKPSNKQEHKNNQQLQQFLLPQHKDIPNARVRFHRVMRMKKQSKQQQQNYSPDVPDKDDKKKRRTKALLRNATSRVLNVDITGWRRKVADHYFTVAVEVEGGMARLVWFRPFRNVDMKRNDGFPMFQVRVTARGRGTTATTTLLDWTRRSHPAPADPFDQPCLFQFDKPAKLPVNLTVETRIVPDFDEVDEEERMQWAASNNK